MENPRAEAARPDPDALLAGLERGQRGHLKIFLGAAPGVGKTWEMLDAAHAHRMKGVDVVAGLIETHGRAGTAQKTAGLEMLRRLTVPYRGQMLEEFDLDAALTRHPQLLLVDELAHTNVPGLRHAKRWQDVQELLAAGIDVWSTVNVQHLESLNDQVARITGVRVAETLPDTVLDMADEIELIDLPPNELRTRLREGHIYRPDIAGRALENRVREEAKRIHGKYVSPPHTTDFAVLYLPTEGLYAEVIRRPGLFETLQREHRVTVAGPTTLSALLNSLQMGFRTLAIAKRSSEVWKILGAVKTEFGKFSAVLETVRKRLEQASAEIDKTGVRSRAITRKLRDVELLEPGDSRALLGVDGDGQDADAGADAGEAGQADDGPAVV